MDILLNREFFLKNSFLEGALLMAKKSTKIKSDTEISLGLGSFIVSIISAVAFAGIVASAFHFPLSNKVDVLANSVNNLAVSNAKISAELNTLNRILLKRHAFETLNNGYGAEIVRFTDDGIYKLQRGINYVAVPNELKGLAFRPSDTMFTYMTLANAASFSGQYNEETGEGLPEKLKDVLASGLVPLAFNCEGENSSAEVGNNIARILGCTSFPPTEALMQGDHVTTTATQKQMNAAWSSILGGEAAFRETEIGMKWVDYEGAGINLDVFVYSE